MGRLIVIDGALIGWLIYGNMLFYSPRNNCAHNPHTEFANDFMSCILLLGYMMMFMYGLLLITVPCLYIYFQNQLAAQQRGPDHLSQQQIPAVL